VERILLILRSKLKGIITFRITFMRKIKEANFVSSPIDGELYTTDDLLCTSYLLLNSEAIS
jgi:hypothetical protein